MRGPQPYTDQAVFAPMRRPLVVLSCVLLASCGQSGDLYLPPEAPEPPAQPAAAATPATAPDDDETKKE